MTISTDDRKAGPFVGNGSQTAFPFDFKVFAKTDLRVVFTDDDGGESDLVLDSVYGVTLNADQDANPGGTITYPLSGSPLTSAERLTALGDLPYLQPTDIANAGGFYPQVIEDALDRGVMLIQQLDERSRRTLQLAISTESDVNITLPAPSAGALVGWDASGESLRNYPLGDGISIIGVDPDDLADGGNVLNGDAMVGVKTTFTGSVATTQHQVNQEIVNAFRFMTVAQIASVMAGDKVEDVTAALQAYITAVPDVRLPRGIYKISAPLNLRTTTKIFGAHGQLCQIWGTHAGVLLNVPVDNKMTQFDNLRFGGVGCTGLYVNPATASAEGLIGYLNQCRVTNCEFGYELAYGVYASLLLCKFSHTGFGRIGTGSVPGMVAVRAFQVSTSLVNANLFDHCTFQNCGGTHAAPTIALQFNGGSGLEFHNCDFEGNTRVASFVNMGLVRFTGVTWMERNGANAPAFQDPPNSGVANGAAVAWIILAQDITTPLSIVGGQFSANTTSQAPNSVIQWNGNAGIPSISGGITIKECIFGLTANQRPIYNGILTSYKLHPAGTIVWAQNYVTGGHSANTMLTDTQFYGPATIRASGVISAAGGITSANGDPLVQCTLNSPGFYTLVFSNPICAAVAYAAPFVAAQNASIAIERALSVTDLYTMDVYLYSAAGTPTSAAFSYQVI